MTINNGTSTPAGVEVGFNEWSRRVESRADLGEFIRALSTHFRQDPRAWENGNLTSFLDALAAWTTDMDGYFKNRGEKVPEAPTWAMFAQMLLAARIYE
jgi:hypothetical protein